jgi:hypothetical protein
MIDVQKYQLSEHVFSHPMDAQNKSRAMGLGGFIHVYDIDGQAYYMPGCDHDEYLEYMGAEEEEERPSQSDLIAGIKAIVETLMEKSQNFKVVKLDDEQRIIYGWASVTTVKGEMIVDTQGDVIETETLHKAVNDFMENVRVGKLMHQGEPVGQIIHSFPISKEICDALGIQTDMEGWITGYKVYDENLWQDVKAGKYAAFSIGGAAIKEEYLG